MAASFDICNPSNIYQEGFSYSLPRNVLEGFLDGKGFDWKGEYTSEEQAHLKEDISALWNKVMSKKPANQRVAVISAGAPGAGKSTLMEQDIEANGGRFAYIDPDRVCLLGQTNTYLKDVREGIGRREAYNKWRPASNGANHLILGNLIREGMNFYFGTTSSGPATKFFYDFLKKQRYQITVQHVTAPDDVRWNSIQKRDQDFVQTTEQDAREKGDLLPQRINDTFLAFADKIEFYYRDGVHSQAKLAAVWIRNQPGSEAVGVLNIVNQDGYDQIKRIHNAVIERLAKPELRWEETVEMSASKETM